MAEDTVRANIQIDIDTASAVAQLRTLEAQISKFNSSIVSTNDSMRASLASNTKILQQQIGDIGQFSTQIKTIQTDVGRFSSSLEKGKLSFGEYFRYGMASTKTFGKSFTKELNTINATAEERVKTLSTRYLALGKEVNGMQKVLAVRPEVLPQGMATDLAMAAQKQQIFNQLLRQGSTHLVNWGKNTQWAGRQLMVGFTIPLTIFGGLASKVFMDLEKQAVSFRRVYGDAFTPIAETDAMLEQIKGLGVEFTKYGISASQTMEMAAKAAATGAQGADLLAATTEATRLATLGQIDQQQALDATIALQSAFGLSATDLAGSIDFLNAVENQTVVSLDDITQSIPRAATVIKGLGGDVKDLSAFLAAMRENGVNAAEGANALKSGLASLINPTKQAKEQLESVGINIDTIVNANRGDLMGTVQAFALAINSLDDLSRQQTLAQVFGKFQFARMGALFENIVKDGSQASRVLELMGQDVSQLAALSDKELGAVSDAVGVRFQGAVERLKIAIAPIGEIFLKVLTPIVDAATKVLEVFNSMPNGIQVAITAVIALLAGVAPVFLMGIGLIANGLGNMIKGFDLVRGTYQRMVGKVVGSTGPMEQSFGFLTQAELEASAAASTIDEKISGLTRSALVNREAIDALAEAYTRYGRSMASAGASSPQGLMLGRVPRKMASGGKVGGNGNRDSEPALLMPGEFVINKDASEKYGPILEAMNNGNIAGYAKGRNVTLPNGGSVGLNLPDRNTERVLDAIYRRLELAAAMGSEALEAYTQVLRSMSGEVEVTTQTIDRAVSQISEIASLALSEVRSGSPTSLQRQSERPDMQWVTKQEEISAIQSEVARLWPEIAQDTKKMRNISNTQASHLEVINAAGERVDRDWTDLANLTPDLGAINNYLNRIKHMNLSAEDVERIMSETGFTQEQVNDEIRKLKSEMHPSVTVAGKVFTAISRLDEELSLAAVEAGEARTRINTISATGYQATAGRAVGETRLAAPEGVGYFDTLDDRRYVESGRGIATAINQGIDEGNPGSVIEREVLNNARAASPPPWSLQLGNWIGQGINQGMDQSIKPPTLSSSQMRGAVMLGGETQIPQLPINTQAQKEIEALGLSANMAAVANEKDTIASNIDANAHINNAEATALETSQKKRGLGGFRSTLYALDGLAMAMSFLPGPIGDIAQKSFIVQSAFLALDSMLRISIIGDALKKFGVALIALAASSGLKAAGQGVSSAVSTGADAALTASVLRGNKAGKAAGMFSKLLGPLGKVTALFGRLLPAIGRLFPALVRFVAGIVNLVPGFGQLASIIIAVVSSLALFGFAFKNAGDKVRDLGESAKIAGDQLKSIAEKFGFTERTSGFQQITTAVGGTEEARTVAQEAQAYVKEDGGMQEKSRIIGAASDINAEAALRSMFADLLASGAPRDVAVGIVEAVANEAGKQNVFVPIQSDITMSFDNEGKIKDIASFLSDSLKPAVDGVQESFDNLGKQGFNQAIDQGAIDDAKKWMAAVDMLPEFMKKAVVPQYEQKKAILETSSAFNLLKTSTQSAMNLISAQFVNGEIGAKKFNAGMASIEQQLSSLPNNQGLEIMKQQMIDLYPESESTISSITDAGIAFDILSLQAQGVDMGGFIQQMQNAGVSAKALRDDLDAVILAQSQLVSAQSDLDRIEKELAKERAKPTGKKGKDTSGGGGGTKDPFADRENAIRDEQASITIKEIKIDRKAEDMFDKTLQRRLGQTSITVGELELPLDSIAEAEYAMTMIGEEIENIQNGPLKAYENQIESINDEVSVYKDQLDGINHDIEMQNQAIGQIEREYKPVLDSLEKQRKAQEDILQNLEDERDKLLRPYEDQIALLERQKRVAEETAKPRLEALDNEEKALDVQSKALDDQIGYIDDQSKALSKVQKINENIARQQKNRLGLTQALAEGDIYAATAAANEMKQESADQAAQTQQDAFDTQKDSLQEQKDLIEERKDLINDERDAIDAGLESIQKQIDAQEYQTFLIEDSYRLRIQDATDAIANADREINKQQELRDAKIKPYQDIIDNYAPQIDSINNVIYAKELAIKAIQADMKPYEDKIIKLGDQKTLLEDINGDIQIAIDKQKLEFADRKKYLEQELQILAAKKEMANLSSGGGGGGGTANQQDAEKIAQLERDRKAALEAIAAANAALKEDAPSAQEDPTTWYQTAWENFLSWFDNNVVQAIINNPILKAIAAVGVGIVQLLGEAFTSAWNKFTEVWSSVSEWFNGNVILPIQEFFRPFSEWVSNNVIEPVKTAWKAVTTWFDTTVITPIKNAWKSIVGWIDKELIQPLKTAWESFVSWTKKPFNEMVEDVKTFFRNIPGNIAEFISTIPDKFADIVGDADKKTGILGKLVSIKDWFMDLPSTVVDAFGSIGDTIVSALKSGLNAIIRVWNGLQLDVKVPDNPLTSALGLAGKGFTIGTPDLPEFNAGGGVSGNGSRDSVQAMLSPGEFVVRKAMVDKYGTPMFNAINQGSFSMPTYDTSRSTPSDIKINSTNSTNISAPMYNSYSVGVNVSNTNASADEIANITIAKIKQMQGTQIRSGRGY
jgi:TP901 family phage tail tape measure protein